MHSSVLARIAQLKTMDMAALHTLWGEVYDTPAPQRNRAAIISRLTYRLQELAHGVDHDLEARLAAQAQALLNAAGTKVKRRAGYIRPVAGTTLLRNYKGTEHQVTVLPDGYEYCGRVYKSLSKIALRITGAQWSGPAFFGLAPRKGVRV
jgi:hypothetical protein